MSQNKHKPQNNHYNFNKKNEQKTDKKEEIKAVSDIPQEEQEDLSPPQDMNLKLQIEKENSIALTNMLKTLQADFENYRKRNANLKKEAYDDGVFTALKRMLSCYDAVCGALKSIKDEEVKKGLEILEREFLSAFADFGVTPIKAEGEMFDANLHNAIASEEKSDMPSGKIITEVLKGFQSKDKVIRYSLVIIAK